jgi:diacylglycerol kinase family enzyme
MRIVLVHNRKAGKGKVPKKDLHAMLEKADCDIVRAKPGTKKFHEALEDAKLVVAAGGDGAVTKVALALRSTDPPIAILPLGTANNIARALGVPTDPKEAIGTWKNADKKEIDVWTAKGPWGERRFIEGCGLGALTRMAHHMDKQSITAKTVKEEMAIARAKLLTMLQRSKPVAAEMTLDDQEVAGKFLLLEALNFASVGPRLSLSWAANPSDGFLDVGYAREAEYDALCKWLESGASPEDPAPIALRRGKSMTLSWKAARFRIGDGYWPDMEESEPREVKNVTIGRAKDGPKVLVPKSE